MSIKMEASLSKEVTRKNVGTMYHLPGHSPRKHTVEGQVRKLSEKLHKLGVGTIILPWKVCFCKIESEQCVGCRWSYHTCDDAWLWTSCKPELKKLHRLQIACSHKDPDQLFQVGDSCVGMGGMCPNARVYGFPENPSYHCASCLIKHKQDKGETVPPYALIPCPNPRYFSHRIAFDEFYKQEYTRELTKKDEVLSYCLIGDLWNIVLSY